MPSQTVPPIPEDELLLALLPGFQCGTPFELSGPLFFRAKGLLEALTHQRMAVAVPLPILGHTLATIVREGEEALLEARWGVFGPGLKVPVHVHIQDPEVVIRSPQLPGQHIILLSEGVGRMTVQIRSTFLTSRFSIRALG